MPAVLVPRRRRAARAKWRAAGTPATVPCRPDPLVARPRALHQRHLFHACQPGAAEGQSALLLGELGDHQAGVTVGAWVAPDGGKPGLSTLTVLVIRPAEMEAMGVWSTADFTQPRAKKSEFPFVDPAWRAGSEQSCSASGTYSARRGSPDRAARVPTAEERLLRETQSYLRLLASAGRNPQTPAAGDRAWHEFYAQYNPLILRAVRSQRIPPADVEDCVQEVWTYLLGELPLVDPDPARGRFCAWLLLVARHTAIQYRRRLDRSRKHLTHLEGPIASPDSDPAALHARAERAAKVREAFAALRTRLSPTSYQVLQLRWMDEKTCVEIASRLFLTPQQVWYRLTRAKKKLRRLLETVMPETAYGCIE